MVFTIKVAPGVRVSVNHERVLSSPLDSDRAVGP
jgi:hypothetical protein